jgi:hypothetical protein
VSYLAVYDAVVSLGGAPAHAAQVSAMRRVFADRTGAFGPEDPWFEARIRAFWDDARTRQGFASAVAPELPPALQGRVAPFARAHRGLFSVEGTLRATDGRALGYVLHDVIGGAELVVDSTDEGAREALESAGGLFDARVVGAADAVAMLPGALFHPEDATDEVLAVVEAARRRGMLDPGLDPDPVLDALLRMERALRSHSRVRASYAYRPDLLTPRP